MGLDYAIELYFRIEDMEKALIETAKIAHFDPNEPLYDIVLPNGRVVHVPFRQRNLTGPLQITQDGMSHICTSLLFPAQEDILAYEWAGDLVTIDEHEYRPIGCLYLSIRYGTRYTKFSYTAPSTSISKLMLNSKIMHKRFFDLLAAANGLFALIDIEDGRQRLLSNPNRSVTLRYKSVPEGYPKPHYIDQFVEAAMRVKANLKYGA